MRLQILNVSAVGCHRVTLKLQFLLQFSDAIVGNVELLGFDVDFGFQLQTKESERCRRREEERAKQTPVNALSCARSVTDREVASKSDFSTDCSISDFSSINVSLVAMESSKDVIVCAQKEKKTIRENRERVRRQSHSLTSSFLAS